jgi:hypothetical protein
VKERDTIQITQRGIMLFIVQIKDQKLNLYQTKDRPHPDRQRGVKLDRKIKSGINLKLKICTTRPKIDRIQIAQRGVMLSRVLIFLRERESDFPSRTTHHTHTHTHTHTLHS